MFRLSSSRARCPPISTASSLGTFFVLFLQYLRINMAASLVLEVVDLTSLAVPVSDALVLGTDLIHSLFPTQTITGTYALASTHCWYSLILRRFDGDGMLHSVDLRKGATPLYRNRYVRTTRFEVRSVPRRFAA